MPKRYSVEITRPANTTAYTAGDVISDNATTTTLPTISLDLGTGFEGGEICAIQLATDQDANVAQCRLEWYTKLATSLTLPADNAAATRVYADIPELIGYVDMPAMAGQAGTDTAHMAYLSGISIPFSCETGTPKIYGPHIITNTAFTPASGQKFYVNIWIRRNGEIE